MAGDEKHTVLAPLTSGFARTGYELDTIEARRAETMEYTKASKAESATRKSLQQSNRQQFPK